MTTPFLTIFLSLIPILFITSTGRTQTNKNDLLINFGPSSSYGYPSGLAERENSGIPSLNLSGDYSLSKLFSLGLDGAYTYSFYKYNFPPVFYKDIWKGWDIGVRNAFHISPFIAKNEKADLYMAAFFGYTNRFLVYDQTNIYRDSLNYKVDAISIGILLGLRYFITKNFGLYIETGLSRKFSMSGGISFNINSK